MTKNDELALEVARLKTAEKKCTRRLLKAELKAAEANEADRLIYVGLSASVAT